MINSSCFIDAFNKISFSYRFKTGNVAVSSIFSRIFEFGWLLGLLLGPLLRQRWRMKL